MAHSTDPVAEILTAFVVVNIVAQILEPYDFCSVIDV